MGTDFVALWRVGELEGGLLESGDGLGVSLEVGWRLTRRDRARVGETRWSVLDADDALTAGCDVGDGKACDERCRAGDDIEASRIDGVMKLVFPATLSFPRRPSSLPGAAAGNSRSLFRNVTLRNIFSRSLSFEAASSVACVSFSFPFFVFAVIVAKSSTGGAGSFFDRVAVRILCSSVERNLWKDRDCGSGDGEDPNTSDAVVGCGYREDDASELSL